MTFEELLKAQGLTEEQVTAITGAMKENKIYTTNEENIVIRYGKLKAERDDLKGKLETAETTIGDLKKSNKDNEELQATIKTHEGTIATMEANHKAKIRDISIQYAIKSKLTDTKYPELLETKFDKEKLVVNDDGTVVGIEEQLTTIKETYKDLFVPKVTGRDPNNSGGSPPAKSKKAELEAIINNPETKLTERIAARNQLFLLNESEE
ncbi:phage scaffolding protein [Tissierella sp. Yu-01]|uniref:phage scaffolding protein n=1 Tax=Tissierella sp. Yu-01 TaxID=3035694 RepID=UPI00240D222A|nr:phage scaffolding protein [Tissierella sp. Yu-01]WFA10339.1 phage scaffolding protein [Tissierella sp. Yu-01]